MENIASTATATQPNPIAAIGRIASQLVKLHEIYGELESRLSPVLHPIPIRSSPDVPTDSDCVETPARSAVMEGLDGVALALDSFTGKLTELIERLDL